MVRLSYFVSHLIQYQAPLLRLIAQEPDIELTVFFYSDFSLRAYKDPGFGKSIKWDVPLTEGYNHQFLKCWGSKQRDSLFRQPIASNIYQLLKQGQFDAIWVHGWGLALQFTSNFCSKEVRNSSFCCEGTLMV